MVSPSHSPLGGPPAQAVHAPRFPPTVRARCYHPGVRESTLGAVLAGGSSLRFGRDKALASWNGRTLAARAVAVLSRVLPEVVLVAPQRSGYAELGVSLLADRFPGSGPLAGVEAALAAADGGPVFVLACDLPLVDVDLVRMLAETPAGFGVAVPAARLAAAGATRQPLCGLYAGSCRPWFERCLRNGTRAVVEAIEGVEVEWVEVPPAKGLTGEERLLNVNRPADLERLEALEAAWAR